MDRADWRGLFLRLPGLVRLLQVIDDWFDNRLLIVWGLFGGFVVHNAILSGWILGSRRGGSSAAEGQIEENGEQKTLLAS